MDNVYNIVYLNKDYTSFFSMKLKDDVLFRKRKEKKK